MAFNVNGGYVPLMWMMKYQSIINKKSSRSSKTIRLNLDKRNFQWNQFFPVALDLPQQTSINLLGVKSETIDKRNFLWVGRFFFAHQSQTTPDKWNLPRVFWRKKKHFRSFVSKIFESPIIMFKNSDFESWECQQIVFVIVCTFCTFVLRKHGVPHSDS